MEDIQEVEEIKEIAESPEEHQKKVDQVKEAFLDSIRLKDPKLYFKIKHGSYKPWRREDYYNSEITSFNNKQIDRPLLVTHINRNDLCKCGSGKKVKHCCGIKTYYTVPNNKTNE